MSDMLSPLTGTDRVSSRPDIERGYRTPSGSGIFPAPFGRGGKGIVFCGTVYKAHGTGTSAFLVSYLFAVS